MSKNFRWPIFLEIFSYNTFNQVQENYIASRKVSLGTRLWYTDQPSDFTTVDLFVRPDDGLGQLSIFKPYPTTIFFN